MKAIDESKPILDEIKPSKLIVTQQMLQVPTRYIHWAKIGLIFPIWTVPGISFHLDLN